MGTTARHTRIEKLERRRGSDEAREIADLSDAELRERIRDCLRLMLAGYGGNVEALRTHLRDSGHDAATLADLDIEAATA